MATFTSKFDKGQIVFHGTYGQETRSHPCPDCKGTRTWQAISPAGRGYTFACPRCSTSFQGNHSALNLRYSWMVPRVEVLTVVQIKFGSEGFEYMMHETSSGQEGCRSGNVYREANLFETRPEAEAAAKLAVDKMNAGGVPHVKKHYDATLELSDFQLEYAEKKQMKNAEDDFIWKARELRRNLKDATPTEARALLTKFLK